MCILFLGVNQHSHYPLVILANRDEFYDRPSDPMHYWQDQPTVLAGRDKRSLGSWLGLSKSGRFCAVTNLRTSHRPQPGHSRGELVARFLRHDDATTEGFVQFLAKSYRDFNPFNLVFGDTNTLYLFSYATGRHQLLEDGFHAISNGPPGQAWPKMSRGIHQLAETVVQLDNDNLDSMLRIMQDTATATNASLPQTGLTSTKEKELSSIFVRGADYGTRSTTLLYFSRHQTRVFEYTYLPEKKEPEKRSFLLPI